MNTGTKTYPELINQLRMVAVNSKSIEKRNRMRDNMLRIVSRTFDASSVYICQHDFEKKVSIVRHHFIDSRARARELESDLGFHYSEKEMGSFVNWLYGDYTVPRIAYLKDLAQDDPERAEYEHYGATTAIISALMFEDKLWGYLEIWDSRRNRTFSKQDLTVLQTLSRCISDTILTEQG